MASFGIVCLTPENVAAPWIHFEAGALSMSLNARVSAIMLNVSPSDVKGPLAHYQNTAFEQKDFFRLFQSINKSSETPLRPEILKNAFDNAWDKMKAEIEEIINTYANSGEDALVEDRSTSDSDAVQEILRLVRKMDSPQMISNKSRRSPQPLHAWYGTGQNSTYTHKQFCTISALSADPSDVFSVIKDYFSSEETREAAWGALRTSGQCVCCLSVSEIYQVHQKLTAIGATVSPKLEE